MDYRLYFLRTDGRIDIARGERFTSDAAAAAFAIDLDYPQAIEIWQQKRLVGLITPSPGEFQRGVSGAVA